MGIIKKYWYLFLTVIVIVGATMFIYLNTQSQTIKSLTALKSEQPKLGSYTDEIIKLLQTKPGTDKLITYYLDLGLAWKSLADQTQDKQYYQRALEAYKTGITKSNRTNTILLINAGNMSIYTGDYQAAKSYYEEAIRVAPGDADPYIRLANLHRDYLKSSPEAIIAILDQGISRMPAPEILVKYKEAYTRSIGLDNKK